MSRMRHSVTLDSDRCKGCTNCIKRCPTMAIRVRNGKARIIDDRCIDCGECIRRCPYRAKKAILDPVSLMDKFSYRIALPAPALYGQFNNLTDIDYVLTGLLDLGFDSVYEVSRGAELVSNISSQLMRQNVLHTPVISSACPAIVRLIQVRFPRLRDQVLPVVSPMQAAARMAKEEAIIKTGLSKSQIGVFFISPCPAKVTAIREPFGIRESWIDGAFSIGDIYPPLLEKLNQIATPQKLAKSGFTGIRWAKSGGEASALLRERYLAADGMENVMSVLEALEDDRLSELDFIELNACPGGCVGGVLTAENGYIAKARIMGLRREFKSSVEEEPTVSDYKRFLWKAPLPESDAMRLSEDLSKALTMMGQIEEVHKLLPDLDCGACGAPSCRTMAEDIVKGLTTINECIFILKNMAEHAQQDLAEENQEQTNHPKGD